MVYSSQFFLNNFLNGVDMGGRIVVNNSHLLALGQNRLRGPYVEQQGRCFRRETGLSASSSYFRGRDGTDTTDQVLCFLGFNRIEPFIKSGLTVK